MYWQEMSTSSSLACFWAHFFLTLNSLPQLPGISSPLSHSELLLISQSFRGHKFSMNTGEGGIDLHSLLQSPWKTASLSQWKFKMVTVCFRRNFKITRSREKKKKYSAINKVSTMHLSVLLFLCAFVGKLGLYFIKVWQFYLLLLYCRVRDVYHGVEVRGLFWGVSSLLLPDLYGFQGCGFRIPDFSFWVQIIFNCWDIFLTTVLFIIYHFICGNIQNIWYLIISDFIMKMTAFTPKYKWIFETRNTFPKSFAVS